MPEITISLPDGSERTVESGTTAGELAASIGRGLAKAAVIAEIDGVERDLVTPLHDGARVAIITDESERGLYTIRHSTAHVLAQTVLDLFPGATFGIGPPVENGFYYDFELPDGGTFTPDDLERIDARMREIIKEKQPFVRDEIPSEQARVVFKDHKYKLEIIDGAAEDPTSVTEAGTVRTYENPPRFIDLCRGPHVEHTGRHLGHFKLMRVAGAYWRGDEKNAQLQRIYGTAWATKADLDAHLHRLEEAAKRDHRKLGVELDLFSFPDEIGSGLAVFHPKGGLVRRLMEEYSRQRHEVSGYQFVNSPHITKSDLFETSGHLVWFADGMFPPIELDEGTQYYLKPMNCPFHILIYRSRQRSYRELPMRLFEFGSVYRYEKSGVIHGLTRVRGMTQDDTSCTRCSCSCSTCCATTASSTSTSSCRRSRQTRQSGRMRSGRKRPQRCASRHRRWISISCSTRVAARSTARRSRCRRGTRSAARGRCRPSKSTSRCRTASTCITSARTTSATGRS
jgi:threonyl-tRNA synthetase